MMFKVFKIRMRDQKLIYILLLATFIVGLAAQVLIQRFSAKQETTFEIGATLMFCFSAMFIILMDAVNFSVEFNLAAGMSVPRKRFVPAYYVSSVMLYLIQLVMIYAGHFIESFLINANYPDLKKEAGVEKLLMSWYIIPVILLIPALSLAIGALATYFGKKAFWVFWVIWMLACFLPGRIEKAMENHTGNALDKFGTWLSELIKTISPTEGMLILFAAAAFCGFVVFITLRKQQVTQM